VQAAVTVGNRHVKKQRQLIKALNKAMEQATLKECEMTKRVGRPHYKCDEKPLTAENLRLVLDRLHELRKFMIESGDGADQKPFSCDLALGVNQMRFKLDHVRHELLVAINELVILSRGVSK
jgi:hypothetical protein